MSNLLATLHPDLRSMVGQTMTERYRVDELIAVGGMGAVFRGHHLGLNRDVAIKVLHPDLARDPHISARFDREARSASRLDHPNCLQVTDFGTTEANAKFMVMQLLEGTELAPRLGEPIEPQPAIELVLQIIKGLEHAHSRGVVHRDLKPENIFITTNAEGTEVLKLVDFGIAKIVGGEEPDDHMTKLGLVFGTPKYMSPEQAAGMRADGRADLYSAGIIFYQMLSGKAPFESDDPVSLVRKQITQKPKPLPSSVPRIVSKIVEKLLAKDRDDRYPSARNVRAELEQALEELVRGPNRTIPEHISLFLEEVMPEPVRGRKLLVLGPIVGVIAVAIAWLAWPAGGDEEVPSDPTRATEEVAGGKAQDPAAGPVPARIAEIDRLLLAKNVVEAEKLLRPLRDEHPDDPQLLWRQGRLHAHQKKKKGQALTSYGEAIDGEAKLLEDRDFYAELVDLLHEPKLEDQALDIALRKMSTHGHKFLLELVNREKRALSYGDRHRVLEELGTVDASRALINVRLNVALDLWQAGQSLDPCKSYAAALDSVGADPDPYFLNPVKKAPVPSRAADTETDGPAAPTCEGLAERRDVLFDELAGKFPDQAAALTEGETKKKPKKRRKRRKR